MCLARNNITAMSEQAKLSALPSTAPPADLGFPVVAILANNHPSKPTAREGNISIWLFWPRQQSQCVITLLSTEIEDRISRVLLFFFRKSMRLSKPPPTLIIIIILLIACPPCKHAQGGEQCLKFVIIINCLKPP